MYIEGLVGVWKAEFTLMWFCNICIHTVSYGLSLFLPERTAGSSSFVFFSMQNQTITGSGSFEITK
jgi:hypothetical protein